MMYYIVFDLELNSKAYKSKLPNEVIEIGAVRLDEKLELTDSFQSYIQPKIHRKLFPLIKRKTKITQESINEADSFRNVLNRFREWCGCDSILCSWGPDDIHHLKQNCKLNRVSAKWIKKTFDIQKYFSQLYEAPPGHRYSLSKALEALKIKPEEDLHRAYVDAKYTALVFVNICDEKYINMLSGRKSGEFLCSKI
ncbi:MAG: exonuclease domain-containing protein [Clostridia bacterium]|nr:exonuclease domain-containing protein [Clostridia bacterium]